MIVKFNRPGKSFAGLAAYLTHDAGKAKSSERVRWTHTLNLAHDEIPHAVDEMLWTVRAADDLKREAGVSAGGRKLENPVKHFSLNWHPSDKPSRDEMIEAVQDFLKDMGWEDRQAMLVAHTDKQYPHVHVMLNTVSPEDGRSINMGFEQVRASFWALRYERSQFRIHCEQRLRPYEEREPSPTRDVWQRMKEAERENDKAEVERCRETPDYFERGDVDERNSHEWVLLKTHQRKEREAFFVEGKKEFRRVRNMVYRHVRTEYRGEWVTYFDSERRGLDADSLAEMKTDIVTRQTEELEKRREEACKELRERRDKEYKDLLLHQKEERAELRARQKEGEASPHLLGLAFPENNKDGRTESDELEGYFRLAGREVTSPSGEQRPAFERHDDHHHHDHRRHLHDGESSRVHDGASLAGGLGLGALGGIAAIGERLFDGFFGGGPAVKRSDETPRERSKEAFNQRARQNEEQIRGQEARTEAEKLLAWWQERRERKRERD